MSTRSIAAVGLAVVLLTALPVAAGVPMDTRWLYPTACDGAPTLQACIDAADPGDTVVVATNTPIAEYVTISKTLFLESEPGYTGTIIGGIGVSLSSGTNAVHVRNLTVDGPVNAVITGGTGHAVWFERLKVTAPVSGNGIGIDTNMPAQLTVRSNTVTGFNDTTAGISINLFNDEGLVTAEVAGNRSSAKGFADSGAGIFLQLWGSGTMYTTLANNSVWQAARADTENSAGILVRLKTDATGHVRVVGNTVDRIADDGLRVDDQLTTGGHVDLNVFGNLFAHTEGSGVDITSDDVSTRTIRAGQNAFVDLGAPNDWEGAASGPTFHPATIGFVDEPNGNLALRATSPLLDVGVVCTPGGTVNLDAARHGRLAGPTVDIGAYERGAVAPTGQAFIGNPTSDLWEGTQGADIICGLGGDDALVGLGGRDYLDGGAGADAVVGGDGADRILGGKGDDHCLEATDGVSGNDTVDGGKGTDGGDGDPGDTLLRIEGPAVCG